MILKNNKARNIRLVLFSLLIPVALGIVVIVLFSFKKTSTQKKRPNVIIIIADQWRGQALGFLREDPVFTPHLDSLAKHSLVLKNFISNYPVCSPARGMLMTGQYAIANHVTSNVTSESAPYNVQLATDAVCWSDVLKQNGYSLGYIGKWHLDSPHPPYIPTSNNEGEVKWNEWASPERRHGFDFWYAYGAYGDHNKPMYWSTDAKRMDFHYVNEWEGTENIDVAINYLRNENGKDRDPSKPFALVVSTNIPHTPYKLVPQKYYDLYKNIPINSFTKDADIPAKGTEMGDHYRNSIRYYYAGVTGMDEQIGRFLGALRQQKLDDNTIVLFIADHGDCIGKHNELAKNNMYEESLRVPFILYWEGHVLPRIDSQSLMSYPDIFPTLLDLVGLKNDIPASVQGKSQASYLLDGKGIYPEIQYFMANLNPPDLQVGYRGVRTSEYKLAFFKNNDSDSLHCYLFDLKKDPFEMNNLYGQFPSLQRNLETKLETWLTKNKDPFRKLLN